MSVAGCQSRLPGTSTDTAPPSPPDCPGGRYDIIDARYDHTVTCYRLGESGDETPALVAEPPSIALPDATVTFSFTNPRDNPYVTNSYEWGLHKYVNDRWYRVVDPWVEGSTTRLDGSATHTWTFTVDNSNLSQPVRPVRSDGDDTAIRGLGGGTYAFLVPGTYDDVDLVPAADTVVSYATQFTIEGPSVDLVPTETVVDVQQDDGRVEVLLSKDPSNSWTFTRTTANPSEDKTHTPFITEQLYGKPLVRNAFAHFEDGIEEVVVHTNPTDVTPILEGHATYDGVTYRVEKSFFTDE